MDCGNFGIMWKTVSDACNLACDYCYYKECAKNKAPKIKRIAHDLLEKVIKEYMSISKGAVSFAWQGGEPLLAGIEFFEEVVYLQAKYAPPNTVICNAIQTNATLINTRWASLFKRYNFLVGVSLDGPKDIHDERRKTIAGKGSFNQVIDGIQHLRDANVDFNILTVIHQGNVDKAKELMNFYDLQEFRHIQFLPCMEFQARDTNKPAKYLISPKQYGDFLCDIFDIWYSDGRPITSIRFFDNVLNVYLNREPESCIQCSCCPKVLILEQNGDVYPCDFFMSDDYKIGNAGHDNFEEIFLNPKYKNFLIKKQQLPKKCINCEYLKYCFGGCPRNRVENVDYFCESYQLFFSYAHKRLENIARNVLEWETYSLK